MRRSSGLASPCGMLSAGNGFCSSSSANSSSASASSFSFNGSTFKKGRNLSAWMGIVPGEYSTGGKQKLLGISKRGNKYLRRLFIQKTARENEACQRLTEIPGVGPVTATALIAAVGVQGARSVLQQRHKQTPGLRSWLAQLLGRTHQKIVVVALANKLVRMAWAVLCKNERYRAPALTVTT